MSILYNESSSGGSITREQLHLVIGGAFKSPMYDVNLYITNQPGFNYVILQDGKYISSGSLRPEVIKWLKDDTSPVLEANPEFVLERLLSYGPEDIVLAVVTYGSIHHRDER